MYAKLACVPGVMAIAAIAMPAHAGLQTGPNLPTFTTADNSKDIVLSTGSPAYSADLSTYSSFLSDVHTLAGYSGGAGDGTGDVMHVEGPSDTVYGDVPFSPYVMVGSRADGQAGFVIYKFATVPGQVTGSGGTITTSLYFRGDPTGSMGTNAFIGIAPTLNAEGSLNGISNSADFKDLTMAALFPTPTPDVYDTYVANGVQLSIPEGVSEFYLMFADEYGSGRLGFGSVEVSANVVPEPAAISLLGLGAAAFVSRRRR